MGNDITKSRQTAQESAEFWGDRVKEYLRYAYQDGYTNGAADAKKRFGAEKGITHVIKATPEEIEKAGPELTGWCKECQKPIEGRWVRFANFCPFCGRIIEWVSNDAESE